MNKNNSPPRSVGIIAGMTLGLVMLNLLALGASSYAAPPVVKTVPWVSEQPLIPHDTWIGKTITLKGTCNMQGANLKYTWDFGDASAAATGTVNNQYVIEATHAYSGAVNTVFTARLTVVDSNTGETGTASYYIRLKAKSLGVEVNVAIDEGLWYLHKKQIRSGLDGSWSLSGYPCDTATSVNAFEVNGHLETGSPNNPYTETVARGMRTVFSQLAAYNIVPQTLGNPDSNGNGKGVGVNSGNQLYQGGMFMDAIIASGTPDALAPTGPANVVGRKYKDIIQDMVDYYAYAQYDSIGYGGWRYNPNDFPDNSASQWAAIGLIPAERKWGCVIPAWVKTANRNWLSYSQRADGVYGYTDYNPLSGVPYGTTPSGMVQCAMNGIGRGNPLWDKAETFLRNNFSAGAQYWEFKNNYYGLFAFVKAMLYHDSNGDGIAEPIQFLQSSTAGVPPIDWYSAEVAKGDPTDGLARKIVNDQYASGYWAGYGWFDQYGLTTAWAIMMLRVQIDKPPPVAVAKAYPNPAVAGQTIQLDGSDSYHLNPARIIAKWEWDLDNDGIFETPGIFPTVSFPVMGNYPVKLRVTDDDSPAISAAEVLTVLVSIPPIAPTAVAGGPYHLCPEAKPWFLNATASVNPDEGQSEPSLPGDTIQSYAWDLDGDGVFGDVSGPQPDVTAFFTAKGPGSYVVQLKVTDTTSISFPSSGFGDLSGIDSTTVVVAANPCSCVNDLAARAKPGKVQLTWTDTGAHHYNIYRSMVNGGPYIQIASTTSRYSTYLDQTVANGKTYYYVVREANILDEEVCQSTQSSATPRAR